MSGNLTNIGVGEYILLGTDQNGCQKVETIELTSDDSGCLLIPTGITPELNNPNFKLQKEVISEKELDKKRDKFNVDTNDQETSQSQIKNIHFDLNPNVKLTIKNQAFKIFYIRIIKFSDFQNHWF